VSIHLLELLGNPRHAVGGDGRALGIAIGIVTDNKDPSSLGRVQVSLPALSDSPDSRIWAAVAAPLTGDGFGMYFLPNKGDAVVLAFERGEVRFPIVIGALWQGKEKRPADNADGENNVCVIKSRSGHVIQLTDKPGAQTIEIRDPNGNGVLIDTAQNSLTLKAKNIVLDATGGTIALKAQNITSSPTGDVQVKASGKVDISAKGGDLTLQGRNVNINP
jgi:uncharacterized protein involved in type VI secretion and phage assembly